MADGWMPDVEHAPLNTGHAAITPNVVVVHSVAGSYQSARNYFTSGATNLGSHFITAPDGHIVQLESIFVAMYANFDANWYGISIENGNVRSDANESPGFNADRFGTPEQIDAIVRICRFANTEAGVPLVKATSARSGGVGYHRQFPEWSGEAAGAGSTDCPGDTRVQQFDSELIPALTGAPQGDLFTVAQFDDLMAAIKATHDDVLGTNGNVNNAIAATGQSMTQANAMEKRLTGHIDTNSLLLGRTLLDAVAKIPGGTASPEGVAAVAKLRADLEAAAALPVLDPKAGA